MTAEQKPIDSQWTDDQWKAIISSGQDILVAAAAGSGKTAVLVERIIKKISRKDDPIDVDRLLVVTFTNASAAEMRHRIGEALEKSLKENPESLHLRRQLSLLNRASISTMHSFCLDVIREYYFMLDLDPNFRIADRVEMDLMMEEILGEMLEEQYSIEDNELFFDLIDRFSGDRDDLEVQSIIRKLYTFSRAYPFPSEWLRDVVNRYDVKNLETIEDLPYYPYLINDVTIKLNGARSILLLALEITMKPCGPAPRAKNIEDDLQQIDRLLKASHISWQALYEELQTITFSRAATCRGEAYDEALVKKWTKLRDTAKKQVQSLKEELFSRRPESYLKDMAAMKPVIETLVNLVMEFSERFKAYKQEKGLVDFADLEHYCLEILQKDHHEGDAIQPSDAAIRYQEQFVEVLVDEYQDTNLVQEMILKLVTKSSEANGNLFMVGDVKQSIYRFRLAEPFLFLSKYKKFATNNHSGLKIDLSKNFRSRAEILDSTNFLFKQLMGETVGEIIYDQDAELKLGAAYPPSEEMKTEVLLINKEQSVVEDEKAEDSPENLGVEFDEKELETVQLEARLIAKQINKLIENRFQVFDRKLNRTRGIMYRDIVILLRSMPWAPQIMEEFKLHGIPVYAELSTGYFDATEVSIMLSLFRVIDNPHQDIHLASVLRSPIVGLDPNELATLRIHHKNGSYYEALASYVKNNTSDEELYQKVRRFSRKLQEWRSLARSESLPSLIWRLYKDTQFYDFVGGMPGGKQRQANLRALYDRARQYEATSFRGLFKFLRFVERMQDRGDDLGAAKAIGEQEDVVRLMTIHKSKGLEFPVVFVGGLARQFNMQDLYKSFLLDKDLGLATRFVNPKLRVSYPMLPQITIRQKMKLELIAEEMRVLYVALTRAKEKLYLVGTLNKARDSFEKWANQLSNQEWLLPDFDKAMAKSYLDWIGPALIRHHDSQILRSEEVSSAQIEEKIYTDPSKWQIEIVEATALGDIEREKQEIEQSLLTSIKEGSEVKLSSPYAEQIQYQLNWVYPHQNSASRRSKQTVSEIKRQREYIDEHSDTSFLKSSQSLIVKRPKFMHEKTLTSAEGGTAMHMVMQHIPFNQNIDREFIENFLAKLVHDELLTNEQCNVIDREQIMAFFETEIGTRLTKAAKIHREVPFSLALSAKEAYADWTNEENENVLVQGVMDCIVEDENGVVLLDYKTDTIEGKYQSLEAAKPILEERYRLQIELYSKALEMIWKKPIKEKYLYFFDGGYLIKI